MACGLFDQLQVRSWLVARSTASGDWILLHLKQLNSHRSSLISQKNRYMDKTEQAVPPKPE